MLSQMEADTLIAMRKVFVNPVAISLQPGADRSFPLIEDGSREKFLLDVWRGTIRISKFRYQTRSHLAIILVRVDIDGAPHTNPDGQVIIGSHIHIYREGDEDKWAFLLPPENFREPLDIQSTFLGFCQFCNIALDRNVSIQHGLL